MFRKLVISASAVCLFAFSASQADAQRFDISDADVSKYGRNINIAGSVNSPPNVAANLTAASEAITECDRAALDRALSNLEEQKDSLESQSRQAPNEFFSPEAAASAARQIGRQIYEIKSSWNANYPCGKEESQEEVNNYIDTLTKSRQNAFEGLEVWAGISGGRTSLDNITHYVGSEVPGFANTRRFGEVTPEASAQVNRLGFGLNYTLDAPNYIPNFIPNILPNFYNNEYGLQPIDIFFGLNRTSARYDEVGRMYMANGRDTLLVGVGAGPSPSGYVIGAANGDIENITFDRAYESTRLEVGIGQELDLYNTEESSLKVRPYGGLGYGHSTNFEWLGGVTNAGTLNFDYQSKFSSNSIEPFLGVDVSARPAYLQQLLGTDVQLNFGGRYGYEFINIDGYDSLTVAGALNQTGMVDLSDDETAHNFSAKTGITIMPDSPLNIDVELLYENFGNGLYINRTGNEPSSVDTSRQDTYIGTIRTTFKF